MAFEIVTKIKQFLPGNVTTKIIKTSASTSILVVKLVGKTFNRYADICSITYRQYLRKVYPKGNLSHLIKNKNHILNFNYGNDQTKFT